MSLRTYKLALLGGALSLGVYAIGSLSALAQQAPNVPTNGATAQTSSIETIEVTARRIGEQLQNVPISITVLTTKDIRNLGVQSMGDIANLTPNVNFSSSLNLGASLVTVRGETQEKYAVPPVAVVDDGVLQITPAQFNSDEIELQQIEVLKGPQGAIYGENAIAGAFNITTLKPTDDFFVHGQVQYVSGDEFEGRAAIGGAVVPGVIDVMAGVSYDTRRGQVKNITNGNYSDKFQDATERFRAVVTPIESFEIDVKYTHSTTHGNDPAYILSTSGNPAISSDPFNANRVGINRRDLNDASGRLKWDAGFATVTATLGYVDVNETVDFDLESTPLDIGRGVQLQTDVGMNQDVRVASAPGGDLHWLVGVYHVSYNTMRNTQIFLDPFFLGLAPPPPTCACTLFGGSIDRFRHADWAGFGQIGYDITDELTADFELRYDGATVRSTPTSGPVQNVSFDKWQPKGSVTYRPTSNLTFYGSIGDGFRVGEFNPSRRTFGDPIVKAESATTYEIGAKMALFDNDLTLNAAAYLTNLSNGQFKLFDLNAGTNVGVNIDKEHIRGFEIESNLLVSDQLSFNASVGYTDARVVAFTLPAGFSGSASDYIGKAPVRAPNITANIGFNLEEPIFDGMTLFLRPQFRLVGPYYWDPLNQDKRPTENHLNLRFGVSGQDGLWSVTGFVNNALDEKITVDYQPVSVTHSLFGFDLYYPPVGATYGVELNYRL